MDVDVQFIVPVKCAVQVLDFEQMEYEDYDDASQISFITLQNVVFDEKIRDDILFLPSYCSFVENLKRFDNDCFDNVTNSTTIEDIYSDEMSVNNLNIECSNDCYCEACLQSYFNTEISDLDNVIYSEDSSSNDLCYDFTTLWNQAEFTTYMDFPQDMMCTRPITQSENFDFQLVNKVLAKSNIEGNTTAEATPNT